MVYLPKGSIMLWNDVPVTEHNRRPLSVDVERINSSDRTVYGNMRRWFVADKRTWSTSWELVPSSTVKTVDGKMGAKAIEDFYLANPGSFNLKIQNTGLTESFTVMFTDFSKTVEKRTGTTDLWTIDITLEEV